MSSVFDNIDTPLTKVDQLKAVDPRQSVGFMSLLLVKKIGEKTAKNGSTFLTVDFADKTGSFGVVIFGDSPYFGFFKTEAPEGSAVLLTGTTAYYNDRFSPKIVDLRKLSTEEQKKYQMEDLITASTENPIAMWEELQSFIAKIQDEKLRQTVTSILEDEADKFKIFPAGSGMHHAYRHGLMEHTLHLARVADALLPLYPEVHADLVRAGVVLHDMGKIYEYTYEMTAKFSKLGTLHGHVVIGYRLARAAGLKAGLNPELLERLEHIILSHQGELEFGAAVRAATPEAVFVSLTDNLDAKMGAVQNALLTAAGSDEFVDVGALGKSAGMSKGRLLVKRVEEEK
jgi:3'-5' exoribonuclease